MALFYQADGLVGDGRYSLGALAEDAGEIAWLVGDLAVALLEGFQVGDGHVGHLLLQFAVSHAGEAGLHGIVGVAGKGLVNGQQVEHAGAGAIEIHRRARIGGGAHDGFADGLRRIEQSHGVVLAGGRFAHLLGRIVEAHDARAHRGQAGAGHDEGFAVERVEPLRDIASRLEVLGLVFPHRHDAGLVKQNIGGH